MPRSAKPTLCNLQQGINQINFEIEELLKESVQDNGDKIEDNTWSTRISIDSEAQKACTKEYALCFREHIQRPRGQELFFIFK